MKTSTGISIAEECHPHYLEFPFSSPLDNCLEQLFQKLGGEV